MVTGFSNDALEVIEKQEGSLDGPLCLAIPTLPRKSTWKFGVYSLIYFVGIEFLKIIFILHMVQNSKSKKNMSNEKSFSSSNPTAASSPVSKRKKQNKRTEKVITVIKSTLSFQVYILMNAEAKMNIYSFFPFLPCHIHCSTSCFFTQKCNLEVFQYQFLKSFSCLIPLNQSSVDEYLGDF